MKKALCALVAAVAALGGMAVPADAAVVGMVSGAQIYTTLYPIPPLPSQLDSGFIEIG